MTIISQRVGKNYAIKVLEELRSEKYNIIQMDDNLIADAENLFNRIRSKDVSYSDCISFTTMKRYSIEWVFSFDEHFKKQGFKRIGIDGKPKNKLEELQGTVLKYKDPSKPVGEDDWEGLKF